MKNIYIASCCESGGIYRYELDGKKLTLCGFTPLDRPMYMKIHKDKMYVLLREPYGFDGDSGVVVYDIDKEGNLVNPSEVFSTQGKVACHICVHNDGIYCTNYSSGSVVKINKNKSVHSGKGIHPTRQEMPHTHCVEVTPDGKYLCVTDLGLDKIFVYDTDLRAVSQVDLPSGHGVRHLVFSRDGEKCFAVNELEPTVCVLSYRDGALKLLSCSKSIPDGFCGESFGAAIRYYNGKIYVSNRGHDSLSVLEYKENSLVLTENFSCGGCWPRDFDIVEDVVVCTNERSNNVTFFDLSSHGEKKPFLSVEIKVPLCVAFR